MYLKLNKKNIFKKKYPNWSCGFRVVYLATYLATHFYLYSFVGNPKPIQSSRLKAESTQIGHPHVWPRNVFQTFECWEETRSHLNVYPEPKQYLSLLAIATARKPRDEMIKTAPAHTSWHSFLRVYRVVTQ